MTVTCCITRPRLAAVMKRSLTNENAMIASTSTASGPRIGRACRTCWLRCIRDSARRSSKPCGSGCLVVVTVVGVSSVIRSAPAVLESERRVLRLDAGLRLVGDQRDAGVDEVLARGGLRLGAVLGERGERLDTLRRHLQRVLLRGGPDDPGLDVLDAGAAAVDGHDLDVVLPAGGLDRLVRAGSGRLVDRVEEVDRRVALQQVLHR